MILDDDGQMKLEEECGLNFLRCPRVEEKNLRKLTRRAAAGDRTRARWMKGNDVTPRSQRWSEVKWLPLI